MSEVSVEFNLEDPDEPSVVVRFTREDGRTEKRTFQTADEFVEYLEEESEEPGNVHSAGASDVVESRVIKG